MASWYPNEEGEWSIVKLVSRDPGGGVTLKIRGKTVQVGPEDVGKLCPQEGQQHSQNLADLDRSALGGLGVDAIENVLRHHFCRGLPYTNIDNCMLFINPFRDLPIYDSSWIDKYAALDPSLPPHVFNTAAGAYKRMCDDRHNQAVLLIGEAGSGKSQALTHILDFYVATCGSGDEIDQRIVALERLLRPFLSVRSTPPLETARWSSTRAILSVELVFDSDLWICRVVAGVRLLELKRVAKKAHGRNFNVFYQVAHDNLASNWLGRAMDVSTNTSTKFQWLSRIECPQDDAGEDDSGDDQEGVNTDQGLIDEWAAALQAFESFEIDPGPIVRVISGILLLGELRFTLSDAGVSCQPERDLEHAAEAFGIPVEMLITVLCGTGSCVQAVAARERLAEDLYGRLVAWLVQALNMKMVGDGEPCGVSIVVVDVLSRPFGESLIPAFQGLQLQWIEETVFSNLLPCAFHFHPGADIHTQREGNLDISRLGGPEAASRALGAISGPNGLVGAVRAALATAETDGATYALQRWFAETDEQAGNASPSSKRDSSLVVIDSTVDNSSGWGRVAVAGSVKQKGKVMSFDAQPVCCQITGAAGPRRHTLNDDFLSGAHSTAVPESILIAFTQSSLPLMAAIFVEASPSSGLTATEEAVGMLHALMLGEGMLRPWLVLCLRPNDAGNATVVSRTVLQRQVRCFCLADAVNLTPRGGEHYNIAWSAAAFRRLYDNILPTLDRSLGDKEICKILISSMAGGQGRVGVESVYGTPTLRQVLDAEAKERQAREKERAGDIADFTHGVKGLEQRMGKKVGAQKDELLRSKTFMNAVKDLAPPRTDDGADALVLARGFEDKERFPEDHQQQPEAETEAGVSGDSEEHGKDNDSQELKAMKRMASSTSSKLKNRVAPRSTSGLGGVGGGGLNADDILALRSAKAHEVGMNGLRQSCLAISTASSSNSSLHATKAREKDRCSSGADISLAPAGSASIENVALGSQSEARFKNDVLPAIPSARNMPEVVSHPAIAPYEGSLMKIGPEATGPGGPAEGEVEAQASGQVPKQQLDILIAEAETELIVKRHELNAIEETVSQELAARDAAIEAEKTTHHAIHCQLHQRRHGLEEERRKLMESRSECSANDGDVLRMLQDIDSQEASLREKELESNSLMDANAKEDEIRREELRRALDSRNHEVDVSLGRVRELRRLGQVDGQRNAELKSARASELERWRQPTPWHLSVGQESFSSGVQLRGVAPASASQPASLHRRLRYDPSSKELAGQRQSASSSPAMLASHESTPWAYQRLDSATSSTAVPSTPGGASTASLGAIGCFAGYPGGHPAGHPAARQTHHPPGRLPTQSRDVGVCPQNIRGPVVAQQASLHWALSQMAAVLRVAKQQEARRSAPDQGYASGVDVSAFEELRRERDAWKAESEQLWGQVQELQAQLGSWSEECAFWRARAATSGGSTSGNTSCQTIAQPNGFASAR